jgi:MFS family permease
VLTTFDWRWVFGINIPVCAAMLALLAKVAATSPTRPAPFDWGGQILGVLALAGLTFGLIEGRRARLRRTAGDRHTRNRGRELLDGGWTRRVCAHRAAGISAAHVTVDHPNWRRWLAMPPTTGLVLASVAPERAGTASAVFNTFRQVGGAVAIAIFGALIADRTQFIAGLQTSLTIAAVLLLATVAMSVRIRPTDHR